MARVRGCCFALSAYGHVRVACYAWKVEIFVLRGLNYSCFIEHSSHSCPCLESSSWASVCFRATAALYKDYIVFEGRTFLPSPGYFLGPWFWGAAILGEHCSPEILPLPPPFFGVSVGQGGNAVSFLRDGVSVNPLVCFAFLEFSLSWL